VGRRLLILLCAQRGLSNVRGPPEIGAMRVTRPARRRSRVEIAHQSRLGAIDFDNLPMSSQSHATCCFLMQAIISQGVRMRQAIVYNVHFWPEQACVLGCHRVFLWMVDASNESQRTLTLESRALRHSRAACITSPRSAMLRVPHRYPSSLVHFVLRSR
jgi:hypothetical protein